MGILSMLSNILADKSDTAVYTESESEYEKYLADKTLSDDELEAQKNARLPYTPTVDIIICTNTKDESAVTDTVLSILLQTYSAFRVYVCGNALPSVSDTNIICKEKDGTDEQKFADVIKSASGECIMLCNPGDILQRDMLFELVNEMYNKNSDFVYCDSDEHISGGKRVRPQMKPDFSPDTLYAVNYIGNSFIMTRELFDRCGVTRSMSTRNLYELILAATDKSKRVTHVPKVLFTRGACPTLLPHDHRHAVNSFLRKKGSNGYAVYGEYDGSVQIRYPIQRKSSVSVVVVNDGDTDELMRTLTSIEDATIFPRYNIIVANTSVPDERLKTYLRILQDNSAAVVLEFSQDASFAAVCNESAEAAHSKHIIFMRSGMEIVSADWIERLICFSENTDIGIVSPKIVRPNNELFHTGVVIGIGGWWGSPYYSCDDLARCDERMNYYVNTQRNVTAVSSYCFAISADKLKKMRGFDETIQSDACVIDLCLRLLRMRHRCVYTPFSKLCCTRSDASYAVAPEDYIRCYDACRDTLLYGDANYSVNYDYTTPVPMVIVPSMPAIVLNPLYRK